MVSVTLTSYDMMHVGTGGSLPPLRYALTSETRQRTAFGPMRDGDGKRPSRISIHKFVLLRPASREISLIVSRAASGRVSKEKN